MQKIGMIKTIVALTAFVLMVTIVSSSFTAVTFAAEDIHGNRIIFPLTAWKQTGPSPWFATSGHMQYNLSFAGYNPYSTAPQTAHVLWGNNEGVGGVAGGFDASQGFYAGMAIRSDWNSVVTFGGKVYVATHNTLQGGSTYLLCLDEETGKILWVSDALPPSAGDSQTLQIIQRADPMLSISPKPTILQVSGTKLTFIDPDIGRITQTVTFPRSVFAMWEGWNDTIGIEGPRYGTSSAEMYAYGSGSANSRENYAYVYQFGDRAGAAITPKLIWQSPVGTGGVETLVDNIMVARMSDEYMSGINRWTGKVLWTVPYSNYGAFTVGYGKVYNKGNDEYIYAWDLNTGALVWKSEIAANGFYNQHSVGCGEGIVVQENYDGNFYAFDALTGKLKWRYYIGDCPFEPYKSWYGTWPCNQQTIVCSGAVVGKSGDHGQIPAMPPGESAYCFDSQTGKLRWTFPAGGNGLHNGWGAIADGMVFFEDSYTSTLWAIGKGPSAVTVSVPKGEIASGEYTWITGTVTDQSAGQPDTPCVSQADMQAWMEYLHCGTPASPTPKTGVTLTLYAKAATTGTVITIGNVTTDGDTGQFSTIWTPPTEDLYTITGTFLGDEAYWGSYGSTTLAVGTAPAAASIISSPTTATMTIASLAAVVVGAIVIQKRPLKNGKKEMEK